MKYLLGLLLLSIVVTANAQDKTASQTVLLLNSYHPQYAWTNQLTNGVIDALLYQVPPENIHVEYMDSRRFVDDGVYSSHIKELLIYKYQQYKPDVIITSDDHAYYFMLENRDSLFPDMPIVFCGVNVFDPNSLVGHKDITGILEGMEVKGNLDLIKQLQPEVRRVILLGDTTGLGLRMVKRAREIQSYWYDQKVIFEIWDDFSMAELYEEVAQLSSDTAILLLAIHKDKLGQYFSFEKELKELARISTVPIYGMWGGLMIGNGSIGGLMNDPYEHGQEAGFLALAVLSGVSPKEISIQPKAKFTPIFDYNQLQKFDIDMSRLPANSQVVNKPVSVYETYKREINSIIIFVGILIVIINFLLVNITRRIQMQKELDALNKDLEDKVIARTQEIKQRNHELEDARKRMEELANTDALTGLGNRRAAQAEVTSYVNRAHREGKVLSVALLDIDHFKRVNDQYGHQTGDDVLFGFAQVVKQAIRPSDRVYRWGGEEFLILLPNTDLEFSSAVCNRITRDLHAHVFETAGIVTASIGVSSLLASDDMDSLINRADDLLYQAKDNGRDQVMLG